MSFLTDDFDPRLLLLTIEANYKPTHGSKTPVSGLLVLSRVGLHFYSLDARKRDGRLDRNKIEHFTFTERNQRVPQSISMLALLPLGKHRTSISFRLGYLAAWGSGGGEIIAGVSNLARRAAAKDENKAFIEAVREAERLAPPLPALPQVNPHMVRMNYFADASALGPALFFADRALACARLQAIQAPGLGTFKRLQLFWKVRSELTGYGQEYGFGMDRKNPLPIITPKELTSVKRQRAWLLIDGQRYETLIGESKGKQPDTDAEVTLAYGVAQGLLGYREQASLHLMKALQADPTNPRIMAGAAWGLALQGRAAEARQMAAAIPATAREDRHAMLLLGCAAEALDNKGMAMTFYLQSAALAMGYFQGAVACLRALALANTMDVSAPLRAAQELIAILPEQREAWQGLAQAADRAGNTPLARQAQERITAMQGPLLLA